MDRRSFLTSLAAACTALTSAATAGVTVSASTDAQRRSDEFRRTVLSMLKDCEVLRVQQGLHGAEVVYRYAPGKPRGRMAKHADRIAAIGTPATVTTMTTFDHPPLHLGGYQPFDKMKLVHEVVIQWHV